MNLRFICVLRFGYTALHRLCVRAKFGCGSSSLYARISQTSCLRGCQVRLWSMARIMQLKAVAPTQIPSKQQIPMITAPATTTTTPITMMAPKVKQANNNNNNNNDDKVAGEPPPVGQPSCQQSLGEDIQWHDKRSWSGSEHGAILGEERASARFGGLNGMVGEQLAQEFRNRQPAERKRNNSNKHNIIKGIR